MGLRIKNWKRFQHYKYRRPPWIRLYRDLIDDPEWHKLDGLAAKSLIMLWIIASENDGSLPDPCRLSFRLRITEKQTSRLLSDLSHWVEQDASKMLATCLQHATPERETERETEKDNPAQKTRVSPQDLSKEQKDRINIAARDKRLANEHELQVQIHAGEDRRIGFIPPKEPISLQEMAADLRRLRGKA